MTKVIAIEVSYIDEDNVYHADRLFFALDVQLYHPPGLKENYLIIFDPDKNRTDIPLSRLTSFHVRPVKGENFG